MSFNYQGIWGVDISTYQDSPQIPGTVDFVKMRNAGASFCIMRVGQGNFIDQDWQTYKVNSRGVLPRGPYWFYDPQHAPKYQAELCLSAIGDEKLEGRLWLDLEFNWTGSYMAPSNWRIYLDRIKAAGLQTGIYTSKTWWDSYAIGADMSYFGQEPLWVAQYNSVLTRVPAGFPEPLIWQDGTPAIGPELGVESLDVDHDKWNSNYDFAAEWSGTLPPDGGTVSKYFRWNSTAANIRKGPGTQFAITGNLVRDDVIQVDEPFSGSWAHFVNAQHKDGTPVLLADGTKAVDNPDCWCTTSYLVEVAGLPNPPPDPPPSEEYILYVKDGVTRKFIPE